MASSVSPKPPAPPWLATEAKVTSCRYQFARMNTLTLGFAPDSNRFQIGFTYYAHGTLFADQFLSPIAVSQGSSFPILYNPLHPQQNSKSTSTSGSGVRNPLFAIGVMGSIVLSLLYFGLLRGCN